jgi:hypothetical protein
MTRGELRKLLDERSHDDFVDRQILNRIPWIFDGSVDYSTWLVEVAADIDIPTTSIRIVGSAATGYSLSPLKPGRPFRPRSTANERTSDIDVALLDDDLFYQAWDTIVGYDRRRRLKGSEEARAKLRLDVYWGVVSQNSLPQNTEPARRLLMALAALGRRPPLRGYTVRCRVYRRIEDLRAYHVESLRHLRAELESI